MVSLIKVNIENLKSYSFKPSKDTSYNLKFIDNQIDSFLNEKDEVVEKENKKDKTLYNIGLTYSTKPSFFVWNSLTYKKLIGYI